MPLKTLFQIFRKISRIFLTLKGVKQMETVNQIEYNGTSYNIQDAEAQKSLVYSQNETDTGKIWIDGKKIYRKVILLPAIARGVEYKIDLSSLTVSNYIQLYGFIKGAENYFMPLLNSDEERPTLNAFIGITNNVLRIINGAEREILSGFAVLEYTKTTN